MLKHTILCLMLLCGIALPAQKPSAADGYVHVPTMTDLFARAPRTVFPLLDRNTRLDMIDYYNSGLATPSRNLLGGSSRITAVGDRRLDVAMTDASSYTMSLLTSERGDTVIALVRTLRLPVPDSDLRLYTTNWTPIDAVVPRPGLEQWLVGGIKGTDPDVVNLIPFVTATIDIGNDNTLTMRPSLAGRYTPTDSAAVAGAMKPQLQYRWNAAKRQFK